MSAAIAKVEPLTTARALRGPFDYVLPERLGDVGVVVEQCLVEGESFGSRCRLN